MVDLKWYAVRTKSRHEKQVEIILKRMGFETWLPLCHTRSRRRDRVLMVDLPALPGYLFIHCSMIRDNSAQIKGISGVIGLVEKVGAPCVITDDELQSFRLFLERSNDEWLRTSTFQRGDRVRIIRGPLEGVKGYLTRLGNQHQITITIPEVPYAFSLVIDELDVEKINE